MLVTFIPVLLLSTSVLSQTPNGRVTIRWEHGHRTEQANPRPTTTRSDITTTQKSDIEIILNNSTEIGNEVQNNVSSLPVAISNPWINMGKLDGGFGSNMTWTSKSIVPRLFADMGRAGFPPIETVMKWSCWDEVDEAAQNEFREIFNENNTKGVVKTKLNEWIIEYNGTKVADKIRTYRDDFDDRMKLFSVNFEAALSTLSTAVRTFNDIATDDEMTIGQANTVLNNIADMLDKNLVKSVYKLFDGNVMNGKKLQNIIAKAVTTTHQPIRYTAPPNRGNTTGQGGVWNGNWKRYTVVRRITQKPALINAAV